MSKTKNKSLEILSLKESIKKLIFPGFLMWLIPFVVSIFFYDRNGDLLVNYWVFKISMVLVGILSAIIILRPYYNKYKSNWVHNTDIVLTINIILDLIFLVGFLSMSISFYIISIVPVYLAFMTLTNYYLYRITEG